MTFNEDAKISGSGVRRSGRRTGLAVGGGGLGLVAIVLISQLFGVDLSPLLGGVGGGGAAGPDTEVENCETGADANARVECRISGAYDSLDDYWTTAATEIGVQYSAPQVRIFTGSVETGCGGATSAVGPFYCPLDQTIYLDTAFYDDLENRFGAEGGPLAELYVVAHEWGHHVQNQAGVFERTERGDTGPDSDAVRTEVQADCYAGAWVGEAANTQDADGNQLIQTPTEEQVNQALDAASAIGDDRIQETTTGQVNPETWTHGSGEQRQEWFKRGYENGAAACDTFALSDSEF